MTALIHETTVAVNLDLCFKPIVRFNRGQSEISVSNTILSTFRKEK
jgi:hypothetical protein